MLCLNLCDILNPSITNSPFFKTFSSASQDTYERIYIGSYFCSQYFLKNDLWDFIIPDAKIHCLPITLVVPIVSEKDLSRAKDKISCLLGNYPDIIDEVTVNDYGMYCFCKSHFAVKLNIGRLFFKDPRDIRIRDYTSQEISPAAFSCSIPILSDQTNCFEIDQTNDSIDIPKNLLIGIHKPLCYMTTGFICKYASISKPIHEKFRPNAPCGIECSRITEHHFFSDSASIDGLYRIGRAIYSHSTSEQCCSTQPARTIYFPYFELLGNALGDDPFEDSGSTEQQK